MDTLVSDKIGGDPRGAVRVKTVSHVTVRFSFQCVFYVLKVAGTSVRSSTTRYATPHAQKHAT